MALTLQRTTCLTCDQPTFMSDTCLDCKRANNNAMPAPYYMVGYDCRSCYRPFTLGVLITETRKTASAVHLDHCLRAAILAGK